MAMSLFSSFDALLAEKFGQRVSLSWATTPRASPSPSSSSSSPSTMVDGGKWNKGKEGNSSSHANKPREERDQHQQKRRPRFAVELDGVHCFETIIPS